MQVGNSNSAQLCWPALLAQLIPNTTATHTITYTKQHYRHVPRRTLICYSMIGPSHITGSSRQYSWSF